MITCVVALVAAALVAALHMGYLVYMVLGGFLALRRFALLWPHVASTIWSCYVTLTGATCPVTTVEKWLLAQGGRTPYEGSFISQYLQGTLYPARYETAIWLAAMGIAVFSYALALRRRSHLREDLAVS